ncbi:MAG: hypothetical protein PHQ23_15180 [Candidatus Wallbacteria bacterium]|nr:hypothetical protein [Candidatus Wallbacteria bacterium]
MEKIRISLADLFWETRGLNWDYQVVTKPKISIDWTTVIHTVTETIENPEVPSFFCGTLNLGISKKQFIGFKWKYPGWKDSLDRKIPHTVIWFPPSEYNFNELKYSLPNDWQHHLMNQLASVYKEIFDIKELEMRFRGPWDDPDDQEAEKKPLIKEFLSDTFRKFSQDHEISINTGTNKIIWTDKGTLEFAEQKVDRYTHQGTSANKTDFDQKMTKLIVLGVVVVLAALWVLKQVVLTFLWFFKK